MPVSKIKSDEIKNKIKDLSCGLLATAIDFTLFEFFLDFNLIMAEGHGSRGVSKAIDKTMDEVLACGIDKEAIKKALWKAGHRGFIKRNSENKNLVQITEQGLTRLRHLLPLYQNKRIWDKHLYLITYDIPEKDSGKRQLLRESLKQLDCGMLQASVWLTPYNPKKILKDLVLQYHIPGSIIVSDLGKEGSIGEEDLDDLVSRVYDLNGLNERYRGFIYELKSDRLNKAQAYLKYLSILKNDPQLPFEILPYSWLGDKTYQYLQEKFPS